MIKKFLHSPDRPSIIAVVARWFPNCEIDVSLAETGISTPVFRVLIQGEIFWVRLGENPDERRDGEVAAHRRLVVDGAPIPEVIRYEAAPPELDRCIVLTSHMPGTPLADLDADSTDGWLTNIAREVGRALAQINRVPARGFGWASESSEAGFPVAEHADRSMWTAEYRNACRIIAASGMLDSTTVGAFRNGIEQWAQLPNSTTGSLSHGDFDTTHIYVDPEYHALTGFIDFGELRGADPFYDLGHLLLHEGEAGRPRLFPHVLNGYSDVSPLPDDAMDQTRMQALAIRVRALAIQMNRPPSAYRDWLGERLTTLVTQGPELYQA